jgi:hypothetical protein
MMQAIGCMRVRPFVLIPLLVLTAHAATAQTPPRELYASATVAADGDIHILTIEQREIVVRKENDSRAAKDEQAYFEGPRHFWGSRRGRFSGVLRQLLR